ncbi:putative adrenodoxin [Scenedesmus sp. NREL 46B-D3]|nr:putative adrenodoxin [Scenedesmus sp. NREL 46B-D3]
MLRTVLPSLLHRCLFGAPLQQLATACSCSSLQAAANSSPAQRWGQQQQQSQAAAFHSSAGTAHGHGSDEDEGAETISVTFVSEKDGSETTVKAPIGKHLLEVAHDNDVELEGACEASLACSTCHVIVEDEDYFHRIPEPTEDELDMLDLAFGLAETSRLGCQVVATKELDGLRVKIPSATRNFYVDGHVPKPH